MKPENKASVIVLLRSLYTLKILSSSRTIATNLFQIYFKMFRIPKKFAKFKSHKNSCSLEINDARFTNLPLPRPRIH